MFVFLYTCKSETLIVELQWRIHTLEMRCYETISGISYIDHITNGTVWGIIRQETGLLEDLKSTIKKRKLNLYGHVIRANKLSTAILQGTNRRKNRLTVSPSELEVHSQTVRLASNQHIWREFIRCSVVHWPGHSIDDDDDCTKITRFIPGHNFAKKLLVISYLLFCITHSNVLHFSNLVNIHWYKLQDKPVTTSDISTMNDNNLYWLCSELF